jgi:hypothetical protein
VLTKITELLDRKLFETSVAAAVTELAATTHRFEETVAGLLDVVSRFVDYHLAAVLLLQERVAYISVKEPASFDHYRSFLVAAAETVASSSGEDYTVQGLDARVADPEGHLDEDEEARWAPSCPCRCAATAAGSSVSSRSSSSQKQAFSETAFTTLKLLDEPAAIVIDNARPLGDSA